jgi:DNA-directed RNA polymerase specialized sigma24 family protein
MDDAELIAATARGDADAFAVLYRRHLPRVVGFGLRATGDPEVAADLAAEVFAAALASCPRYRPQHDSAALPHRRRARVLGVGGAPASEPWAGPRADPTVDPR